MPRTSLRLLASLLTFVFGVAIVWLVGAASQSASRLANVEMAGLKLPKAAEPQPDRRPYMDPGERQWFTGYGDEGIKCSIAKDSEFWVSGYPIRLRVRFANVSVKDVEIPSELEFEILNEVIGEHIPLSVGFAYYSRGWFAAENG